MPITNLNKVVNLFIIGALTLLLIGLTFWEQTYTFIVEDETLSFGSLIGFATIAFLPLSTLFGAVVESITDLFIRVLFTRKIAKSRQIARFLLRLDEFKEHEYYKKRYVSFLKLSHSSKLEGDEENEELNARSAQAIFFDNASAEHIQWLIRHYARYHLITQLILIFLFALPLLPKLALVLNVHYLIVYGIYIFCMYTLVSLVIGLRLYSYELLYRHASHYLAENYTKNKSNLGGRKKRKIQMTRR